MKRLFCGTGVENQGLTMKIIVFAAPEWEELERLPLARL